MSDFSQIDDLLESDVLEALGVESSRNLQQQSEKDEIKIEDLDTEDSSKEQIIIEDIKEPKTEQQTIQTTVKSDELVSILEKLLDNKTLEITIKVKD